jgi:hypothetical protein
MFSLAWVCILCFYLSNLSCKRMVLNKLGWWIMYVQLGRWWLE